MNSNYKFYPNPATGHLTEEDTKKYFSILGFAVFAMGVAVTIMANALALVFSYITEQYAPELLQSDVFVGVSNSLVSMIPIYCIGLPIFLTLTKTLPKISPLKQKMSVGKWFGGLCIASLAMMIGNYISNCVLIFIETLGNITTKNPVAEATSASNVWVTIALTVIVTPILEELVFRKLVCDRLLPLGEGYAVFVSAAIFGLMHQNFYQFGYAFVVGALFAFIYVKTGKLSYSILYHMIINFFGGVIAPWIIELIDIDKLMELLESANFSIDEEMMLSLLLLAAYEAIMMISGIIGLVLFLRAKKNRELTLDSGILPPPKEHRIANIFCTVGVAAAVTYFVIVFVLSLFQ